MAISYFIKQSFYGTVLLICVLGYLPGIPPHVEYQKFDVDPALPRKGALAKNNLLDEGERLFEGQIQGPESVASRAKNEVFVSLHNGSIARIWGQDFEKLKIVANIGPGCAGLSEEHICGRPLGLRFSKHRKLLVADSYLGIFSVDVDTGKKEHLVDASLPIDGFKPLLVDDLDEDSNGYIYWSDASSTTSLSNALLELVSSPSGRLIKYDPKTKTNQVLISNLSFANGVQLSPDESFVLVSETGRHRVWRYWLKGPKAGSKDIFVSGLPGMPDNIRPRKAGGYYVSLVITRHPDVFDLYEKTSRMTLLRKIFTRASAVVQKMAEFLHSYTQSDFFATLAYKIFNFGAIPEWVHPKNESIIVEVDEEGNVVGSLQGSSGVIKSVSETQHVGQNLFFGTPFLSHLGRIRLNEKVSKDQIKPPTKAPKPSSGKKDEL